MALCALRRAGNRAKISKMAKKPFDSPVFRSRPLLNVAQVVFLLVIVGAIIVAIDLNRRAQAGRLVGSGEEALRLQVEGEATRQVAVSYTHLDVYKRQVLERLQHQREVLPPAVLGPGGTRSGTGMAVRTRGASLLHVC